MTIQIRRIGFFHPSNANWSYQIFLIESDYRTMKVKSTFGADYRLSRALEAKGFEVKTNTISDFEMKYRDIKGLKDIDADLVEIVTTFVGDKND